MNLFFLIDTININEEEKNTFLALKSGKIDKTILKDCLYLTIKLASIYYDKKVILLLDEYDVPLAKASENGYYKEMLDVLNGLLSNSFKDNKYLKMAVIPVACKYLKKVSLQVLITLFRILFQKEALMNTLVLLIRKLKNY